MGTSRMFTCRACGYRAEVSGGDDAGTLVLTTTVTCTICRRLYDVPVATTERLPPTWTRVEPACPKDERHPVERWSHPGPCPRCGQRMRRGPVEVFWD